MNRTDRLLAIVLELQAPGQRRAQDLARLFETSKRTIYRDIQALCEAGVPVVAMPGQGYALVEGCFYHARGGPEVAGARSLREADPYGLVHFGNSWLLVAHCHLRNFRIVWPNYNPRLSASSSAQSEQRFSGRSSGR